MNFTLSAFKKITQDFQKLAKLISSGSVDLNYHYGHKYELIYTLKYSSLGFESFEKMHEFSKVQPITTGQFNPDKAFEPYPDAYAALSKSFYQGERIADHITSFHAADTSGSFKSLKLVPETVGKFYRPFILQKAPIEVTEGDYTYRIITNPTEAGATEIGLVSRNDDDLYDYLDKGYYVMKITSAKLGSKFIVSDVYDVNTAHIFMMCWMEPELSEMLQKECFINSYEAEMTRLKMHRKLKNKDDYSALSKAIDEDYQKNTTLIVVGKLVNGEIEKTTIGNVTFSKNTAKYEHVTIEAANLLDVMYRNLNFNQEFDIYTVTDIYSKHIDRELDRLRALTPVAKKKDATEADEPAAEAEEDTSKKEELPMFKVNGIEIVAAVNNTGQRFVNNIRINKEEVGKVIHRASCHRTSEDYKLFLKSISRMSIKWHDIISNGMQVKIHEMTRDEYSNPLPGPNAPALKFYIDPADKHVKLYIDENRGVRTMLGRLIKRVETLNKRTDNYSSYVRPVDNVGWGHRVYRTHEWAAKQLIEALVECSMFKKKVTKEDGTVEEKTETSLTAEDLKKLLNVVNVQKKAAIERSKQFLNTAINLTGAVEVDFMGKKAYKVSGGLREYAVVIENAKVYDFATKQYRCIVNDRHYAGAGYDDIAARLLALKNDSVMQKNIGTLAGEAQPRYENYHNDYRPERDSEEKIESLVNETLNKQ